MGAFGEICKFTEWSDLVSWKSSRVCLNHFTPSNCWTLVCCILEMNHWFKFFWHYREWCSVPTNSHRFPQWITVGRSPAWLVSARWGYHTENLTLVVLCEFFRNYAISIGRWLPYSSNLSLCDYFLWDTWNIFLNAPTLIAELKTKITEVIGSVD